MLINWLHRCAGAVGLYFLVRRCAIMYLSAGNGSFGQAPYLDVHGEVDYGMRYVSRFLLSLSVLTWYTAAGDASS